MPRNKRPAQERIDERLDGPPLGSSKQMRDRKLRLRNVADILQQRGIEPIGAICDVLPSLDPSMQVKTLLSLTEFVYPKLGRTEVTGADGGPVQVGVTLNVVGVPGSPAP